MTCTVHTQQREGQHQLLLWRVCQVVFVNGLRTDGIATYLFYLNSGLAHRACPAAVRLHLHPPGTVTQQHGTCEQLLRAAQKLQTPDGRTCMCYWKVHRVLAASAPVQAWPAKQVPAQSDDGLLG